MIPIGSLLKSVNELNASVLLTPIVTITNVEFAPLLARLIVGVAFGLPVPPVRLAGM
jgi:hypothetical protein